VFLKFDVLCVPWLLECYFLIDICQYFIEGYFETFGHHIVVYLSCVHRHNAGYWCASCYLLSIPKYVNNVPDRMATRSIYLGPTHSPHPPPHLHSKLISHNADIHSIAFTIFIFPLYSLHSTFHSFLPFYWLFLNYVVFSEENRTKSMIIQKVFFVVSGANEWCEINLFVIFVSTPEWVGICIC